jgi:sec-independent protein translocase protein TatB
MFDIGWGELVVIGIVALIAIGPKELPTVLRSLGQWMGKIKRMANEFQGQFQEALREAEMADLKKQADELHSAVTDATKFDPLADIDNDGEAAHGAAEPEKSEPETSKPESVGMHADEPVVAAAEPEPTETLPPIDVLPPEAPQPVTEKDFASAEPPPKQAGGNA